MAWGSLRTVDRQLSLSDKLPARERKRERVGNKKKKDEWNKERANSAVWWRRAPFHSKTRRKGRRGGAGGGRRSWWNRNGRELWREEGRIKRQSTVLGCGLWELFGAGGKKKKKGCGSMSVTSPFSCNIVGKAQFCVGVTLIGVTALNTGMHSACLTPSAPLQASLYIRSYAASGFCFTLNPIYSFYTTKCNKSGKGSAFLGSWQINMVQIKRILIKKGLKYIYSLWLSSLMTIEIGLTSAGVYTFVFKKTLNAVVKCTTTFDVLCSFIFFWLLTDIFVI